MTVPGAKEPPTNVGMARGCVLFICMVNKLVLEHSAIVSARACALVCVCVCVRRRLRLVLLASMSAVHDAPSLPPSLAGGVQRLRHVRPGADREY